MKELLYRVTDCLGWLFCEMAFRMDDWLERPGDNWMEEGREPFWWRWISNPSYRLGCWLYGVRPNE